MASWNIPALINKISEDVPAIKALLTALFKWTDADTTDVPVGAKRLQDVAGGKQMQEYSGSAWGNVGKLMHDVDMLDGKHASTAQTADTIPVRDANGTIPGNISGNAATATTAYGLAGDFVVPVANGGTGATTEAGARASLGADNASNISSGILGVAYGGTGSSQKNFVDLTENQNVGGTKTFSSEIKSTVANLISGVVNGVSNADSTRGQRSTGYLAAVFDKDGKRFASIDYEANTDGSRSLYFTMKNRADNGWLTDLRLKELADGTVQTLAKTPPATANDAQIATTAWVTTLCETTKKYLKKTGDALTGKLQCTAKYTNADTTYTSDLLTFNSENDNYGNNVALGGGGNTIVGGGESYANQLSALAGVSAENLYLCADGNIYLKPNCQTFANAKTITLNTAAELSGLAKVTATSFVGALTGNCSGNAANVTGTVAIANGGTGATTLANARKALFGENMSTTNSTNFAMIGDNWEHCGYLSISEAKTVLGLKSAAYTESSAYAASNHSHSAATQSAAGFISAADKKKLDGIAAGAQVNRSVTFSKNNPSGGSNGAVWFKYT